MRCWPDNSLERGRRHVAAAQLANAADARPFSGPGLKPLAKLQFARRHGGCIRFRKRRLLGEAAAAPLLPRGTVAARS